MDNAVKQRIASHSKAERLAKLREAMKNTPTAISDEEILSAYEADKNVKEVRTRVHLSSSCVTVGKLSRFKGADISEEERAFLENSSNNTRFEMFPRQQKKLLALLQRIHAKETECSIGDSSLMTLETFRDVYLPFVKKEQEELDKIKESISDEFDDRLLEFEKETRSIVGRFLPEVAESVGAQLNFLRNRGKEGYLSQISIEISTKFGDDESEITKEQYREFLSKCKAVSDRHQAEAIVMSLFDDLWKAVLSYLVNISSQKYAGRNDDLSGFIGIRDKLKKRALKVRQDARPLASIGAGDIVELTNSVESLSLETDGVEAPDIAYDNLVKIYVVARQHYGYELSLSKTGLRSEIPSWLNMSDIVNDAEAIIKDNLASSASS